MKVMEDTFAIGFFRATKFKLEQWYGTACFYAIPVIEQIVIPSQFGTVAAGSLWTRTWGRTCVPSDPEAKFDLHHRSSAWKHVSETHLHNNPTCAACGGKEDLTAHHIEPFHVRPDLELSPSNLITLCEGKTCNCHLHHGHLGLWRSWNANIREDAAKMLAKIKGRP